MKHKNPQKTQPPNQKATLIPKNKRPWWALIAVIIGAIAGILYWGNRNAREVQNMTSTSTTASVPAPAETDQLVGRWVRTDSNGAYTLEIRSASDDGKLDASYFNPNPINVGRSEWNKKEGSMTVVVELRDVNYPGSTYTLSFSKTNDQLVGTYYQAVEGANYDVAFARTQ